MIERKNSTQRILPISSACLVYQISSFFPWSVYPSAVNKLVQHDLLDAVLDAVHLSYPFKLIGGFERFGHTLPVSHLPGEQIHPISTGSVDLRQMLIQLFREKQIGKQDRSILFRLLLSHPAIFTDREGAKLLKPKIGEVVIAGFVVLDIHKMLSFFVERIYSSQKFFRHSSQD